MRLILALVVALALAGCSNPVADDPVLDAGPSRELAERPAELEGSSAGGTGPGAGASPGATTPGADGGEAEGEGEDAPDSNDAGGEPDEDDGSGSAGSGGSRASVDDRAGDHGLRAPEYADIVDLVLDDRGSALRLSLTMAGEIPQRLPEDEVQGMGIDLYRPGRDESSYQVFIDGSSDGWFAYFSTPQGFRKYPGSFAMGGPRMVFDVPWSALRLGDRFEFDSFCDWTRNTTGVVNLFAEDHAPDRSRAGFQR